MKSVYDASGLFPISGTHTIVLGVIGLVVALVTRRHLRRIAASEIRVVEEVEKIRPRLNSKPLPEYSPGARFDRKRWNPSTSFPKIDFQTFGTPATPYLKVICADHLA